MTQSKSRRLLYQQARLIRIQWAVIMALVCTIVLMAIFLPKAKAIEETAVPALELEPTSYVTPEIMPEPVIEAAPEEIEPVLEELGEFRLTAYCACCKCCGKDPGDFGYGVTASGAVVEAGRTIAVDSSVIPLGSEIVIDGHTYVYELDSRPDSYQNGKVRGHDRECQNHHGKRPPLKGPLLLRHL